MSSTISDNQETNELSSLDNVLYRLGMTEDDKLESVLEKLLPRLLTRLGQSDAIRSKVMSVLQHINKRLKGNATARIPTFDLLELIKNRKGGSDVFTTNFALMYLELGIPRMSVGEKSRIIPMLICGIASLNEAQQKIMLHCLIESLPCISISGDMKTYFSADTTDEDRKFILEIFMDILLLTSAAWTSTSTPPGMTPALLNRLKLKTGVLPSTATISLCQVAIVKLLVSQVFSPSQVMHLFIVARCTGRSEVVDLAESSMARFLKHADLDSLDLVKDLLSLLIAVPERTRRSTFTLQVRELALQTLVKLDASIVAEFACLAIDSIRECINNASSSTILRASALDFVKLVLRGTEPNVLRASNYHSLVSHMLLNMLTEVSALEHASQSLTERESVYSALSVTARVFPELFNANYLLVRELFALLEQNAQLRIATQELLGNLCECFTGSNNLQDIEDILRRYAQSNEPKARLMVAHWAVRLFPFSYIPIRYICLCLSCDPDTRVRQAAVDGFLSAVCGQPGGTRNAQDYLTTLRNCASLESGRLALVWTDNTTFPEEYAIVSSKDNLTTMPGLDAWIKYITNDIKACADSTNETKHYQYSIILGFTLACIRVLDHFDMETESLNVQQMQVFKEMVEAALNCVDATSMQSLHRVASRCLVELVTRNIVQSQTLQSSWILKWLGSDSVVIRENISMLVKHASHLAVDSEFLTSIKTNLRRRVPSGISARHGAILATSFLLTSSNLTVADQEELSCVVVDLLKEESKVRLITISCIKCIDYVAKRNGFRLPESAVEDSLIGKLQEIALLDAGADDATKMNETSNTAILKAAAYALVSVFCSDSFSSSAKASVFKSFLLLTEKKQYDLQVECGRAASYIFEHAPHANDFVKDILQLFLGSTKTIVKGSCTIWLYVLVALNHNHALLEHHIDRIHEVFASELRDPNAFVREAASRGMACLFFYFSSHQLELRSSLARLLATKPSMAPPPEPPKTEKKEQNKSKEEASDKEIPPGHYTSVVAPLQSVYQEIFRVATRIGKPELTYRMLYLSVRDSFWFLPSSQNLRCLPYEASKKDPNMDPELLEKLLPVIYPYKFAREVEIRDTMTKLWESVTPEATSDMVILEKFFPKVIEELIRNISSLKVRERIAGANALDEILRGVPGNLLLVYLERIFTASNRLIDDADEASKAPALTLALGVSKLMTRLCRVSSKSISESDALNAMKIIVPMLLERGMHDQSREAQALSVHTLARVVEAAEHLVRPFVSDIVGTLVDSMGALEDQVLHYAMFHTTDRGGDLNVSREQLETLRVQAAVSSPMQRAVDQCIDVLRVQSHAESNTEIADCLMPRLCRTIRTGVGLPTLNAACRCIGSLCSIRFMEHVIQRHALAFFRNAAARLQSDRSPVAKQALISSSASMCQHASITDCGEFAVTICSTYDTPGDVWTRLMSGQTISAILNKRSEIMSQKSNAIVPLAFVARYDNDEDVAEAWLEVWNENIGTVQQGGQQYVDTIFPYMCNRLLSSEWLHKRQVILGFKDLASPSFVAKYGQTTLDALVVLLTGRMWNGQECVFETIAAIFDHSHGMAFRQGDGVEFSLRYLIPEGKRDNDAYASTALLSLGNIARTGKDESAIELMLALMEVAFAKDNMPKRHTAALVALSKVWRVTSDVSVYQRFVDASESFIDGADVSETVALMNGVRAALQTIPDSIPFQQKLVNLAWKSVVHSKLPRAIVSALEALCVYFERSLVFDRNMINSSKTRLQYLLQHRDSAVLHAATKLHNLLEKA